MRNAAASFDDDFAYDEPARREAPRKPSRAAPSRKKKKSGWSIDRSRIARYGAIGISAVVALGIVYNALIVQKGHHPAPLFGHAAPAVQARQAAAPAVEAPPAHVAQQQDDAPVPVPVAKPTPIRHAASGQHAAGADAIAQLLQGGGAPAVAEKPEGKSVAAAQRALTKLGFAVKANGTMGPATRKALERFEQDRHLPMKGELTRRVVKILSAESGIKID